MTRQDASSSVQTPVRYVLPEAPERHYDEVTSYTYVHNLGHSNHLARHFGKPETTIVGAELYMVLSRGFRPRRAPDLLIAFDVDPELYFEQNGYVVSDQGKPPDFVLEVGSPSTGRVDTHDKREEYAELGIREYWRFDHDGKSHGTLLAGDRLVDGNYQPMPIADLGDGVLQGQSDVLGLWLRWYDGELLWIDPQTGEHIATFDSEREARLVAEAQVQVAEAQIQLAEAAQRAAEARMRELEDELRRRER